MNTAANSRPARDARGRPWQIALRALSAVAILLLATECASFVVLRLLEMREHAVPMPEQFMPAYRHYDWAPAYWREQKQLFELGDQPFPGGLSRGRAFNGETITSDERGIRRTTDSRCQPDDKLVYVFGGSNVWGYGVTDSETVPSHLAKRFLAAGRPACVVNYGSNAWTADEGVVHLALELKRAQARRPDVVVFLGGSNEIFTPFLYTGRIDRPWTFHQTESMLVAAAHVSRGSLDYLVLTNTRTLTRRLLDRFTQRGGPAPPADAPLMARQVVDRYLANIRAVDGLSRTYGFRYAFFWQPIAIAGKKTLTPEEQEGMQRSMGSLLPTARTAVELTLPLVQASANGAFHDLTNVFDGRPDSVYVDICHLLPEGNRIIADRIYDVIK